MRDGFKCPLQEFIEVQRRSALPFSSALNDDPSHASAGYFDVRSSHIG